MADLKFRTAAQTQTGSRAEIDEGLRSYMLGVYNYMALGVAFTAIVTLFMAANPALMLMVAAGPMKWVLFAGILGLGWFAPRLIFSGNPIMAHGAYWLYAGLWGLLISPMVAYYMNVDGGTLIIRALGITAITFAATSLVGYVTKRNLSALGTFFMIACIGLILAMIANVLIFQSELMGVIVSCIVVLVFAGITAYETQMIKQMYVSGEGGTAVRQKSIFGAFMLYGSFITLFIHILNILGFMSSD